MKRDCIEIPMRQTKKQSNFANNWEGTKSPKPIVVTVIATIHIVSEMDKSSFPSIYLQRLLLIIYLSKILIVKAKHTKQKTRIIAKSRKGLLLSRALNANDESAYVPLKWL